MAYGIGLIPPEPHRRQTRGRSALGSSTRLRTLAWLRYLLDHLDQVRDHALGETPAPPGWKRRAPDAEALQAFFRSKAAPAIHKEAPKRALSLLDKVFGVVRPSLGRWFSDKARRGLTHPDEQQLKWLDDLVPGSKRVYEHGPKGMDAGFYDALDFESPWFGRLYLWRVMDPAHQDDAWEGLLKDGHTMQPGDDRIMATGFPHGAWRRRFELWKVRPAERRRLRDETALAMAHVAYPDDVDENPGFDSPRRILRAARAACERDPMAPNPIRDRVQAWNEKRQWAALTDALAAHRLDQIAVIGDGMAGWWVRSVVEGMAATLEKRELEWFYPMTNGVPALTTLVEGLVRRSTSNRKS